MNESQSLIPSPEYSRGHIRFPPFFFLDITNYIPDAKFAHKASFKSMLFKSTVEVKNHFSSLRGPSFRINRCMKGEFLKELRCCRTS